jgi:polar amino acid transport system substrate-binding protein
VQYAVPMHTALRARWLAAAVTIGFLMTACGPSNDNTESANPTVTSSNQCAKNNLNLIHPGQLTVATDSPAYPPWFVKNDPSNGKGYESAVAYAVADKLGFSKTQVHWVKEDFNRSYAPGQKDFDFDINQISITDKRAQVVDFSDGYYNVAQSLVTLKDSQLANATSLADLKDAKLGAQVGTTSLDAITDEVKPTQAPLIYNNTNDAKSALQNGQIDGIVVDLPTAFYITAVQIPNSTIVGQFRATTGQGEQFGMLFEKGNPLVACVNQALSAVKSSGELAQIEQRWLSQVVNVPVLN